MKLLLALWWAFMWRTACCYLAAPYVATGISYPLTTLLNNYDERILMTVAYSVAIALSFVPFWMLLNRGFGPYRLVVLQNTML